MLSEGSADGRGGGELVQITGGPAVRKGARGLIMLHTLSSTAVVLDIIRWCFVVLTALAASGHLAYDAICCFLTFPLPQLTFPYPSNLFREPWRYDRALAGVPEKKFFTGARARSRRLCLRDGFIRFYLFTAPNNRSTA